MNVEQLVRSRVIESELQQFCPAVAIVLNDHPLGRLGAIELARCEIERRGVGGQPLDGTVAEQLRVELAAESHRRRQTLRRELFI